MNQDNNNENNSNLNNQIDQSIQENIPQYQQQPQPQPQYQQQPQSQYQQQTYQPQPQPQPKYQQQTYQPQQQPQPQPQQPPKTNNTGLATASMIVGIVSLFGLVLSVIAFLLFPWPHILTILTGVTALILGIVARKQSKDSGQALAGIITGAIGLGLSLIATIAFAACLSFTNNIANSIINIIEDLEKYKDYYDIEDLEDYFKDLENFDFDLDDINFGK